jgi:2,3-bisphosphoglycerate-dependent phosphoglycerate mutase
MSYTIYLIRHGESQWNLENRFTGWTDVPLSPKGVTEAKQAGVLLRSEGVQFDRVFTSVLKRALQTTYLMLDEMDSLWLPIEKNWCLNERHYGALQGLNKSETAEKYGEEQVKLWRRSYDVLPPLLEASDPTSAKFDRRYQDVPEGLIPLGESLKTTVERVLPYYQENIWPSVKAGKSVLVSAHGNSLRALVMHLFQMSEEAVLELNIPTGVPMKVELSDAGLGVKRDYLGDPEWVQSKVHGVAAQGAAAHGGKKK